MNKLVKAEFFSLTKRKMLWVLSLVVLVTCFLALYMDQKLSEPRISAWESFQGGFMGSFQTQLIMTFMYCATIFGNDMESGVFKNVLSKGETNGSIYSAKLLVSVVYSLFATIAVFLIYYTGTVLVFGAPIEFAPLSDLMRAMIHFLPFIVAANAVAFLFLSVFQPKLAPIWMFLYLTLLPLMFRAIFNNLLGGKLKFLNKIFISNFVTELASGELKATEPSYFVAAAIFFAVSAAAGYALFRKKEY